MEKWNKIVRSIITECRESIEKGYIVAIWQPYSGVEGWVVQSSKGCEAVIKEIEKYLLDDRNMATMGIDIVRLSPDGDYIWLTNEGEGPGYGSTTSIVNLNKYERPVRL